MQATTTPRSSALKRGCSRTWFPQQQQGRHGLHVASRRCRTIARYQQEAAQSETPVQVPESSRQKSSIPIPAPQEMQASVMLVPKETAAQNLLKQAADGGSPLDTFLVKCRLAWNLFFPPGETSASTQPLSPKELGKQRLSMILVADRCGLSPNSLVEMKKSTLAALQDCMDLEDLQDAHLRFTMTRENGVTYSMAVPILRPEPGAEEDEEADDADFDAEFDTEFDTEFGAEFGAEFDAELQVELQTGQAAGDLSGEAAAEAEAWQERGAYTVVAESSDSYAMIEEQQPLPATTVAAAGASAAAGAATIEPTAAAQSAVPPGPKGWAVRPGGTSRAGSRAGKASSRGASPAVEVPLEGSAVMTPDMLKELLVEELVQDVEELVEHMGPQAAVRAMDAGDGTLVIEPTAAADGSEASAAAAVAADVLTEQLEAAVAEVQHFGEGTQGIAGRKGADGKTSSSSKWGKLMM